MTLNEWMKAEKLENEDLAKLVRQKGLRATAGWVSRIRSGNKGPGRKLARVLSTISGNKVTVDELTSIGIGEAAATEAT